MQLKQEILSHGQVSQHKQFENTVQTLMKLRKVTWKSNGKELDQQN